MSRIYNLTDRGRAISLNDSRLKKELFKSSNNKKGKEDKHEYFIVSQLKDIVKELELKLY
jgi:hypothetical protein